LIPTCPTLTKVLPKVAHAFLYTLMDFFQSHQLCPSRCYLTFFHIPERSIALVKRLVHQKELKLIPTSTLTKVLLQGSTRILIYIDGLLSVAPTCPSRCYLLPFSRTFNCTSKTTGWFTKGAEIDPNLPHANKSVTPR
jgi:hypothetical protein